jgi:hypothetical protein
MAMVTHGKFSIMIGDYPNNDEPIIEVEVNGWPLGVELAERIITAIKPTLSEAAKSEGCWLSSKVK